MKNRGALLPCFLAAIAFGLTSVAAAACECERAAGDDVTVAKVQSSWAAGYRLTRAGEYARALNVLRATFPYVRHIRDEGARRCVANGAQNLIASAAAGNAYLVAHPGDLAGAQTAATGARRIFIDCRAIRGRG